MGNKSGCCSSGSVKGTQNPVRKTPGINQSAVNVTTKQDIEKQIQIQGEGVVKIEL